MNNDQLYLKECPETRLDNHFTIEHTFVRSEHKIIFDSHVVIALANDPSLDIFVVPEPEAHTYNEDEVEQAYNIKQYTATTLYDLFASDTPFKVNQVIVCKAKEVIAQRPSKISEPNPQHCSACGNTCCTCDPSYDSFLQSEHDKYYHLNKKVDAEVQPPAITKDDIAVHWLATDTIQSAINVTLGILFIFTLSIGWLFSINALLLTAIGCIPTLLFYNVWVSSHLNRDRNLSHEAFNEKFGQ